MGIRLMTITQSEEETALVDAVNVSDEPRLNIGIEETQEREPRLATEHDALWIIEVAKEAYGPQYNWEALGAWTAQALKMSSVFVLRNDLQFLFVFVVHPLWEASPRAFVMFFAGRKQAGKGLGWNRRTKKLLSAAIKMAKERGCSTIESGTETAYDVGLLLRRLGAGSYTMYRLEL